MEKDTRLKVIRNKIKIGQDGKVYHYIKFVVYDVGLFDAIWDILNSYDKDDLSWLMSRDMSETGKAEYFFHMVGSADMVADVCFKMLEAKV